MFPCLLWASVWILQWTYYQSACFATGRRDQWHPLPSVVMVRQKVIQPQLLAFGNLLAEVSNSPTRRGVTEDIWGQSRQQPWNAGCCLRWAVRTSTSFLFWASNCVLYQLLPEKQWKKEILKVNAETEIFFLIIFFISLSIIVCSFVVFCRLNRISWIFRYVNFF